MAAVMQPQQQVPPAGSPAGTASRSEFGRAWEAYVFVLLYSLTLPTLKIPLVVEMRLGQLVLVAGFGVFALRELMTGRAHWGLLLVPLGCGIALCAISYLAPFPKVKQTTFFIKFLFLYPPAFYIGARLMAGLPPARLAMILEWVLFCACAMALLLSVHPIPLLVHERPEGLASGLKGTFWEQGWFAFFIGLFLLASVALRFGYSAWPRRTWPLVVLYLLAAYCAVASGSLTIWAGLLGALILGGLLYRPPGADPRVIRRWALRLLGAAIVAAVALLVYNSLLPPGEKLVTMDMLRLKWRTGRGAALRASWALIVQQPWFGHGFGYVEAYFGSHAMSITGLGAGVAHIFNSYLDLWLTVGLPGLIYGLALVWAAFDRRVLFSTFVVAFLFVSANINPVAQHEYYYLFLGSAFAMSRWYGGKQDSTPKSEEDLSWRKEATNPPP